MHSTQHQRIAIIGTPRAEHHTLFRWIADSGQLSSDDSAPDNIPVSTIRHPAGSIELIDLPAIHTLDYRTQSQQTVRTLFQNNSPDIVLNVLSADDIEQSLMLTTQLQEMGLRLFHILSSASPHPSTQTTIDTETLSSLLGGPLLDCRERREHCSTLLFEHLNRFNEHTDSPTHVRPFRFDDHVEEAIDRIAEKIATHSANSIPQTIVEWTALRLLEKDREVVRNQSSWPELLAWVDEQRATIEQQHGVDIESLIHRGRYGLINGILEEACQQQPPLTDPINVTRAVDHIILNRIAGLPIFLLLLWVMFETTFTLGAYPMEWIDHGVGYLAGNLDALLPESMFKDLLINGILAGIGGTIIFLPNIVILFFFIALFNESGYMARGAVLVDRFMHRFGLHGKAFIPMITGFGCNVPAIMATRTIDDPKDRLVAILVNPFIICSARLPVFVLFVGAFFPENAGIVLFGIYLTSILVALTSALLLSKTVVPGANTSPFLMELPPYRFPSLKSLYTHMGRSGSEFLKKVTGIILVGSIAIWLLQTFPQEIELSRDYHAMISTLQQQPESDENTLQILSLQHALTQETQHQRYLGQLGAWIQPMFEPIGFDINASIALMTGFIAKEVVVATFGVLFAQGEEVDAENSGLRVSLAASMSPVTAAAFMIFTMFYIPCLATIAVIYKETESLKWTGFSILLSLSLAYSLSWLTSRTGNLFYG